MNRVNRVAQFFAIHGSNAGRVMICAGGVPLKRNGRVVGATVVRGGSGGGPGCELRTYPIRQGKASGRLGLEPSSLVSMPEEGGVIFPLVASNSK